MLCQVSILNPEILQRYGSGQTNCNLEKENGHRSPTQPPMRLKFAEALQNK